MLYVQVPSTTNTQSPTCVSSAELSHVSWGLEKATTAQSNSPTGDEAAVQLMDVFVERTAMPNSAPAIGLVTLNARLAFGAPEHTGVVTAGTDTTVTGASTSTLAEAVLVRFAPQVPSAA